MGAEPWNDLCDECRAKTDMMASVLSRQMEAEEDEAEEDVREIPLEFAYPEQRHLRFLERGTEVYWKHPEEDVYVLREILKTYHRRKGYRRKVLILAPTLRFGTQLINHPHEILVDENLLFDIDEEIKEMKRSW